MPTPETDLILARYVGSLTPDGWTDFVAGTDKAVVNFLTDLAASARPDVLCAEHSRSECDGDVGPHQSSPLPPVC